MVELVLGAGAIASAYLLIDLFFLSRLRALPVKIEAVTFEVAQNRGSESGFYRAHVTYVLNGRTMGYSVNGYTPKAKINLLPIEAKSMKGAKAVLMRPTASHPFVDCPLLRPMAGLYVVIFFAFAFPFFVMAYERLSGKHPIYELIRAVAG